MNIVIYILQCQCSPNFTGERCETKIETCHGMCQNGGTCNNATSTCHCPNGYRGRLCDECINLSCENGGVCTEDGRGKPACNCLPGYSGNRCEKSLCYGFCKNKVC
jgi:low-density lipoprotein receptor-related protein 1 (alpha-2-macroglobulin receptor)